MEKWPEWRLWYQSVLVSCLRTCYQSLNFPSDCFSLQWYLCYIFCCYLLKWRNLHAIQGQFIVTLEIIIDLSQFTLKSKNIIYAVTFPFSAKYVLYNTMSACFPLTKQRSRLELVYLLLKFCYVKTTLLSSRNTHLTLSKVKI
jgi:hypothetical protein